MSVLDPFEVYSIGVWPLHQFQNLLGKKAGGDAHKNAAAHLNDLEAAVYAQCINESKFKAVLNEKIPIAVNKVDLPEGYRGVLISPEVKKLRDHPDIRLARRSATIARLTSIISEREVRPGLRRTLLIQAKRLQWLAEQRYQVFALDAKIEDRAQSREEEDGE